MPDIREHMRASVAAPPDLDMAAVQARQTRMRAHEQQRGRRVLAGVAASLVLITAITLSGQLRGGSPDAVDVAQSPPAVGIDLSGPSVLGEGTVSLADAAGMPLIVYVWGEWCGLCANESGLYSMGRLGVEQPGVAVIGVVLETDIARARQLMEETAADFPTMRLSDPAQLAGLINPDLLQAEVLQADRQATIALNAHGAVVDTLIGPLPPSRLSQLVTTAATATQPNPIASINTSPTTEPTTEPSGAPGPTTPPPATDCVPINPPLLGTAGGTYVVQEGDTLSTIAETVYGDPTAFGLIAAANDLVGTSATLVGQALTIPPSPATATCAPTAVGSTAADVIDPAVANAISAAAPTGWSQRPSARRDSIEFHKPPGTRIRFTSILSSAGRTPAEELQATLDTGDVVFDLPDGTPGSFRNPPATGRVLLLLTADRLLEIAAADGSTTPIDYVWPDLTDWMQNTNATLS